MRSPIALALPVLLASLAEARATGGFWCKAEDGTLTFSVSAAAPRTGGPLFNVKGALRIVDLTVPKDLRAFDLKRGDLAQHWLDGSEGGSLKLHFQRNNPAGASLEELRLIVDAPRVDEGQFEGRYTLAIRRKGSADPFEASGSVSCSAD